MSVNINGNLVLPGQLSTTVDGPRQLPIASSTTRHVYIGSGETHNITFTNIPKGTKLFILRVNSPHYDEWSMIEILSRSQELAFAPTDYASQSFGDTSFEVGEARDSSSNWNNLRAFLKNITYNFENNTFSFDVTDLRRQTSWTATQNVWLSLIRFELVPIWMPLDLRVNNWHPNIHHVVHTTSTQGQQVQNFDFPADIPVRALGLIVTHSHGQAFFMFSPSSTATSFAAGRTTELRRFAIGYANFERLHFSMENINLINLNATTRRFTFRKNTTRRQTSWNNTSNAGMFFEFRLVII